MKTNLRISTDKLLYAGIFLTALLLRLLLLNRTALLESEAAWALQAWEIAQQDAPLLGSQVGYLALTGMTFSVLESSTFLARFWPAVLGSLIIWLPYLLRERLGNTAALTAALGLAVDPGLVITSRLAGGPVFAVVFLLFAAACFDGGKSAWFIFLTAAALFSGPALWTGVLLIALAVLIGNSLDLLQLGPYLEKRWLSLRGSVRSDPLRQLFLPLGAALVLGSSFLRQPTGLTVWADSLIEFLTSWVSDSQMAAGAIPVLLIFSFPFGLIYGLADMIRGWLAEDRLSRFFSVWFGVGLLFLVFYPGRQPGDLIWILIPLWLAAGKSAARYLLRETPLMISWVLAGFIVALLTMNWLILLGGTYRPAGDQFLLRQGIVVLISLLLVGISALIVILGWSWKQARAGLFIGISAGLLLYGASSLVQGAYLKAGDPRSLWVSSPGAGQYTWLRDTLEEVSVAKTGRRDSIDGAVYGGRDALKWQLRHFSGIEFFPVGGELTFPSVVITDLESIPPQVPDLYWGQDFPAAVYPAWSGILPPEFIRWAAFREGPVESYPVILWVREDSLPWQEANPQQ